MESAVIAEVERLLDELGARLPRRRQVLILPHDYPDPDALAAAAAMQLLLKERWRLHSRIVFSGAVSRAENRELLRHFHSRWIFPQQWRGARRNVPAIIVDAAPWSGNVTLPPFVRPVAAFDHHLQVAPRRDAKLLADISPGFGALTTRLAECLVVAGLTPPKWMATIMAYAIAAETQDFTRHAAPRDLEAYTLLLPRCNLKILGQVRNAPLPRAYYGYLVEAVNNAATYGRVAWTHLQSVSQPEIVAEIADLLVRMERITWAFCTAGVENRLLVSVRSELTHANCARLLRGLVARLGGSSGGHGQMAAGFVELSGLDAAEREQRRLTLANGLVAALEGRAGESARPLAGPLPEPPAPAANQGSGS